MAHALTTGLGLPFWAHGVGDVGTQGVAAAGTGLARWDAEPSEARRWVTSLFEAMCRANDRVSRTEDVEKPGQVGPARKMRTARLGVAGLRY